MTPLIAPWTAPAAIARACVTDSATASTFPAAGRVDGRFFLAGAAPFPPELRAFSPEARALADRSRALPAGRPAATLLPAFSGRRPGFVVLGRADLPDCRAALDIAFAATLRAGAPDLDAVRPLAARGAVPRSGRAETAFAPAPARFMGRPAPEDLRSAAAPPPRPPFPPTVLPLVIRAPIDRVGLPTARFRIASANFFFAPCLAMAFLSLDFAGLYHTFECNGRKKLLFDSIFPAHIGCRRHSHLPACRARG